MIKEFKEEFKNLDKEKLKDIINACAGRDVLETDFSKSINVKNPSTMYHIVYVDNEEYGFWVVNWSFKKFKNSFLPSNFGFFDSKIKITPFKIEYENVDILTNSKKQLEEYIFIHINKKCPHYKQAIKEKTEKFISMLEM